MINIHTTITTAKRIIAETKITTIPATATMVTTVVEVAAKIMAVMAAARKAAGDITAVMAVVPEVAAMAAAGAVEVTAAGQILTLRPKIPRLPPIQIP